MNDPASPVTVESAHLEKLRAQISTDIETMHRQEASLREYEQRLRLLIEHAHHSPPAEQTTPPQYYATPAPSRASLDAEWDKYHRAHSLLEAARRGLSDDRMALRDKEEKLHQREVELARREAWVKSREHELEVSAAAKAAAAEAETKVHVSFTTAPFLAARNLLLPRKV